jgi:predicted GIY-YIG superfamily endonuclease
MSVKKVVKKRRPAPRRKKRAKAGPVMHHNVYVVLLDDAVQKHPSVLRLNRGRDPFMPCVYVGMTGLPVEERFENHKAGYKSAWTVKKYGIRLLPELFAYLNPMPYEQAARMEKDLTADLRAQGYTVTGGT